MNDNLIERLEAWANHCMDDGREELGELLDEARAAIERQRVPDLNRLTPFVSGLGKAILQELIEDMAALAAAPQPLTATGRLRQAAMASARSQQ